MNRDLCKSRLISVLGLLMLLALSLLAGASNASGTSYAQAETATHDSITPDVVVFWSKIKEIAVYPSYTGITCQSDSGALMYVYPSLSAADSRQANRFLSLANTALLLDKQVRVEYDNTSTGGLPTGCPPSSCRLLIHLMVEK